MIRMVLKAFVCDGGVVTWSNDEGTTTFGDVYVRRPNQCRYAVGQVRDKYYLIDMYDAAVDPRLLAGEMLDEPFTMGEFKIFDTLDAAIMAAGLTY